MLLDRPFGALLEGIGAVPTPFSLVDRLLDPLRSFGINLVRGAPSAEILLGLLLLSASPLAFGGSSISPRLLESPLGLLRSPARNADPAVSFGVVPLAGRDCKLDGRTEDVLRDPSETCGVSDPGLLIPLTSVVPLASTDRNGDSVSISALYDRPDGGGPLEVTSEGGGIIRESSGFTLEKSSKRPPVPWRD